MTVWREKKNLTEKLQQLSAEILKTKAISWLAVAGRSRKVSLTDAKSRNSLVNHDLKFVKKDFERNFPIGRRVRVEGVSSESDLRWLQQVT